MKSKKKSLKNGSGEIKRKKSIEKDRIYLFIKPDKNYLYDTENIDFVCDSLYSNFLT